ncbi:CYTH domain-containing protein [Wenzhouxiangella marina]|uniref:Adenylate cyclase n=1 Tax=Wenzhouxiangella marina TaxID=1579979 RepID=A0A0K0XRS2_9GAMM|nr:CYTH domain-containing protein [Wenzhouxiangella marina]AKS40414.1 Adenylate cyclase [Wenzhouxiangella marina]MBB6088264.1 CYTH domain-containing protein [Wenzhouxiangella marina]
MGTEIEHKFLVRDASWKAGARGTRLIQAYLSTDPDRTVRVRVAGDEAWLTIKGRADGPARSEFEYPIPLADAQGLLALCHHPWIDKTRYLVPFGDHVWEVDEFHGENEGLIVAEVELSELGESFERPPWLGADVTDDPRYSNSGLVRKPFSRWA